MATIGSHQRIIDALLRCQFPQSTPCDPSQWDWVFLHVHQENNVRCDVVIPDIPGGVLADEIDRPTTFPTIRAYLQQCDAILLLLDAPRVSQGDRGEDFQMTKALAYLHELHHSPGRDSECKDAVPVAIVLTKVDECESAQEDPTKFLRTRAPGVWQQCQEQFRRHMIFACQVAGSTAYELVDGQARRHFPLRIEPIGVLEPFDWIYGQSRIG